MNIKNAISSIFNRPTGKAITWRPEELQLEGTGFVHPMPAKDYIPQWYKNIPQYVPGMEKFNQNNSEYNHTVKACVPLIDAFTAGFIQELSTDLQITRNERGETRIAWPQQFLWEPARSPRNPNSMSGFPAPEGYEPNPYLWIQPFEFGVPKGWSVLITHPLNRNDLPFRTMSAIVDADDFPLRSEITFYLDKKFTGVIEKGTPIFQIIPIKREEWSAKRLPFEPSHRAKYVQLTRNVFGGAYRKLFWKKKTYNDITEHQPASGIPAEGRCPVMHGESVKEVGGSK